MIKRNSFWEKEGRNCLVEIGREAGTQPGSMKNRAH